MLCRSGGYRHYFAKDSTKVGCERNGARSSWGWMVCFYSMRLTGKSRLRGAVFEEKMRLDATLSARCAWRRALASLDSNAAEDRRGRMAGDGYSRYECWAGRAQRDKENQTI